MENMMMMKVKNHQLYQSKSSSMVVTNNINKDSHTISKPKPKIRIIHIFAPEIIKTDVANFRELVQRLTGKPSSQEKIKGSSSSRSSRHFSNIKKPQPRNICTTTTTTTTTTPSSSSSPSPSISDGQLSTEEPPAAAAVGWLEISRERERAVVVKEEVEGMWWQQQQHINGSGHVDHHQFHHHHHQNHFLSTGFGDFDGSFIQELGEFPLFPLDAPPTHHLHGFEEAAQLA